MYLLVLVQNKRFIGFKFVYIMFLMISLYTTEIDEKLSTALRATDDSSDPMSDPISL